MFVICIKIYNIHIKTAHLETRGGAGLTGLAVAIIRL